jgi:hypothetical protein
MYQNKFELWPSLKYVDAYGRFQVPLSLPPLPSPFVETGCLPCLYTTLEINHSD